LELSFLFYVTKYIVDEHIEEEEERREREERTKDSLGRRSAEGNFNYFKP